MDGTARCGTCFREEVRRDMSILSVPMAGGGRRPSLPGPLAAWRSLRAVGRGEMPFPVAVCAACGQPMQCIAGALPPLDRWVFDLGDGQTVEMGPDGRVIDLDPDEADRKIEDHFRAQTEEKNSAATVGFTLVLLASVMALGSIIGACECPNMLLALIGAGVVSRRPR